MPHHANSGSWKPGEKPPGAGRRAGSRNRRDYDLFQQLEQEGDLGSARYLSSIVTNREDRYTTDQRSYAAACLLPYQHSKVSSTPAPVYLTDPVEFPHPRPASIAEATDNIAHIDKLFTTGALDLVSYNSLKETQRVYINTMVDEAKLIAAQGGDPSKEQVIRVEGGLPELPGTNITMPQLNGHTVNGEILAPPEPRILPEQDPDQSPVIYPDDPQPTNQEP
jgi:hypothetical protein